MLDLGSMRGLRVDPRRQTVRAEYRLHPAADILYAGLPAEAIDVHVSSTATLPTPESATLIFPIDGACHRVGPSETAFGFRDATFAVGIGATWPDPADDAGHALNQADPARLEELYEALRLDMTYDAETPAVDVTIRAGRSDRVRGGT